MLILCAGYITPADLIADVSLGEIPQTDLDDPHKLATDSLCFTIYTKSEIIDFPAATSNSLRIGSLNAPWQLLMIVTSRLPRHSNQG
jgi:hypothetical protein